MNAAMNHDAILPVYAEHQDLILEIWRRLEWRMAHYPKPLSRLAEAFLTSIAAADREDGASVQQIAARLTSQFGTKVAAT